MIVRIEEHLDVTWRCTGAQAIADEERDLVFHFERERLNPVAIGTIGFHFLWLEGHDDRSGERVNGDWKQLFLVL